MDEEDTKETLHAGSVDNVGETHTTHPRLAEKSPISSPARGRISAGHASKPVSENGPQRPSVVWVRASDLLNTGTGRIAGRGIDFEAELTRRMRRTPATTRRAIRERADRLPPLSEFGQSTERPQVSRSGLERR